jgi:hypothetical protein
MIGNTDIDIHLKKAVLLDDSIAWIDAHSDEVKEEILNLIRDEQLMEEGVDANNDIIGTYSYLTEVLSGGRKRMGDPYNLNDTGAFFRSMFIKVLSDSILIDADSAKMEDQNWWSVDILGLTEENLDIYAKMVKENFILYARRVLELD